MAHSKQNETKKSKIVSKPVKVIRRQRGGEDDNVKVSLNSKRTTTANSEYSVDLDHENAAPVDNGEFELSMLRGIIADAKPSNTASDSQNNCYNIPTLLQHEFGICYYVSLLHCLFFSRGMRKYMGRQIKNLESTLVSNSDYNNYSWFFIMLWNMIERPEFYKNFNWDFDMCYNLSTSLIASCQMMQNVDISNLRLENKSGMKFTKGYQGYMNERKNMTNTDQGGYVGETLQPVICALQMNNIMFITVENYSYVYREELTSQLSKFLTEYEKYSTIDIIAIKVPTEGSKFFEDNRSERTRMVDELILNNKRFVLDAVQFQSMPDGDVGHVIAGITCPYADENYEDNSSSYPRMVLNSWKAYDAVMSNWNKEHILIQGSDMSSYENYEEAYNGYESTASSESERTEAHTMMFSVSQSDSLYFYTREETSDMDNIEFDRIKANVLTKANMLLGKRPYDINYDYEDTNTLFLALVYKPEDIIEIEKYVKDTGLVNDFFTGHEKDENSFVIKINYNKFVELCQNKLRLIEDILVLTGKVPADIVRDEFVQGGGVLSPFLSSLTNKPNSKVSTPAKVSNNGVSLPSPPNTSSIRWNKGIPANSSIVSNTKQNPVTNSAVRTQYLYFGVVGKIDEKYIKQYKEKVKFNIEEVKLVNGFFNIKGRNEIIERKAKKDLNYYRFDYDQYRKIFVVFGLDMFDMTDNTPQQLKSGGTKGKKNVKVASHNTKTNKSVKKTVKAIKAIKARKL